MLLEHWQPGRYMSPWRLSNHTVTSPSCFYAYAQLQQDRQRLLVQGILDEKGRRYLNLTVFWIFTPALIFYTLGGVFTFSTLQRLWFIPVNILLRSIFLSCSTQPFFALRQVPIIVKCRAQLSYWIVRWLGGHRSPESSSEAKTTRHTGSLHGEHGEHALSLCAGAPVSTQNFLLQEGAIW